MKSDIRGNSSKGKKNKTGRTVIGKPASAAGKTAPAAGVVILKGLNPLRGLKVSRIKMAVENGLYRVDADSVAESMVERFLEVFLGCSVDGYGAYVRRK